MLLECDQYIYYITFNVKYVHIFTIVRNHVTGMRMDGSDCF